ncbi:hypothetical protein MAR_024757 [Mya arenaria]|uniref:Uncharacterized protein n=1 Tax=Mya arenaria TaxID=6604 RepID=A0ABY7DUS8_MYAAR|nr:uncharacterized protein LOC128227589 [Mya arenaria]WAR00385.1 hypothetical protein MAR_024757 [Mya arenaria]
MDTDYSNSTKCDLNQTSGSKHNSSNGFEKSIFSPQTVFYSSSGKDSAAKSSQKNTFLSSVSSAGDWKMKQSGSPTHCDRDNAELTVEDKNTALSSLSLSSSSLKTDDFTDLLHDNEETERKLPYTDMHLIHSGPTVVVSAGRQADRSDDMQSHRVTFKAVQNPKTGENAKTIDRTVKSLSLNSVENEPAIRRWTSTPNSKATSKLRVKFCYPCSRQGKYQIASSFCENCRPHGAHICSQCRSHHTKFPELGTHRIRSAITDTCCEEQTNGSTRKTACHSSQDSLMTTADMQACSYQDAQQLIDDYERYKVNIQSVKQKRAADKNNLNKDKTRIQATILDIRRKLNEQLDFLEASALDELDRRFGRAEDKVLQDLRALETLLHEWKRTMDDYVNEHFDDDDDDDGDDAKNSVGEMNDISSDMAIKSDRILNKAKHNIGSAKLDFVKDINLADDKLDLKSFGSFVEPNIEEFYACLHGDYDVQGDSDDDDCDITSCCVLKSGTVILVDSLNAKVKKVDQTYSVSASVVMPDKPCDVCVAEEDEVAVTVPRNKTVHFLDTKHNMKLKDEIFVGHPCFNVDYYDGNVYVTYDWPKQISVFTRAGTWIKTFRKYSPQTSTVTYSSSTSSSDVSDKLETAKPDKKISASLNSLKSKTNKLFRLSLPKSKSRSDPRKAIFEQLEEIIVCPVFQTVYACDLDQGLVMIKDNGNSVEYIRNFKSLPVFAAKRICRGMKTNFFLYGKSERTNKHGIMHVERQKAVHVMEGDEDFVQTLPDIEAICFDSTTNRIILTLNGSNSIRVFEIT